MQYRMQNHRPELVDLSVTLIALVVILSLGLSGCAHGEISTFQGTPAEPIAQAVCSGRVATLKRLIDEGGDINALDKSGHMSLLYLAVRCGRVETFRTLLAAGVKPVAGADGEPIMLAVLKRDHADKFLTALFDAGITPNTGTEGRRSPLEWSIGRDSLTDDDYTKRLLEHGADINHPDAIGRTPLFYAAMYDRFELIPKLIKAGADPSCVDVRGDTFQTYLKLYRPKSTYSKDFLKKRDALRGFLRAHDIPVEF